MEARSGFRVVPKPEGPHKTLKLKEIPSTKKDGTATRLTAATTGEPLTAEGGWKLTGDAKTITVTQPGKPSQSCKS